MKYLDEIKDGQRFGFGENWDSYSNSINDRVVNSAKKSFLSVWPLKDLNQKSFLDIGSGSGLSSLVALKLGANVFSFDYDQQSVNTTLKLKTIYSNDEDQWHVEQGSVLDQDYLHSIGKFDVVYSWGVLHHTGQMWEALKNAIIPVSDDGHLFIAIYNDQGFKTKVWTSIKKTYCSGPFGKFLMKLICIPYFIIGGLALDLIRLNNPVKRYTEYTKNRGMSIYHDWIDWIGGYPFEVATPQELKDFYHENGFSLVSEKLTHMLGCNEFVFKKTTLSEN